MSINLFVAEYSLIGPVPPNNDQCVPPIPLAHAAVPCPLLNMSPVEYLAIGPLPHNLGIGQAQSVPVVVACRLVHLPLPVLSYCAKADI